VIDRPRPAPGDGLAARGAHGAAALLLAAVLAVGTGLAGQGRSGPAFPAAPLPIRQTEPGDRQASAPPAAGLATVARVRVPKAPLAAPLDLNRADVGALTALPGVGETLARRIVEYRATDGPFRFPDDLLKVPGMGPKRFDRIRPFVRVEAGA
jgi:competence ComEA-like helix-hairpin-helix protein